MKYYVVWNPYPNMRLWSIPPGYELNPNGYSDYLIAIAELERCQKQTAEIDPKFCVVCLSTNGE